MMRKEDTVDSVPFYVIGQHNFIDQREFDQIYNKLNQQRDIFEITTQSDCKLDPQALKSILINKKTDAVIKYLHFYKNPQILKKLAALYNKGQSLVEISMETALTPIMLARTLLMYCYPFDPTKFSAKFFSSNVSADPQTPDEDLVDQPPAAIIYITISQPKQNQTHNFDKNFHTDSNLSYHKKNDVPRSANHNFLNTPLSNSNNNSAQKSFQSPAANSSGGTSTRGPLDTPESLVPNFDADFPPLSENSSNEAARKIKSPLEKKPMRTNTKNTSAPSFDSNPPSLSFMSENAVYPPANHQKGSATLKPTLSSPAKQNTTTSLNASAPPFNSSNSQSSPLSSRLTSSPSKATVSPLTPKSKSVQNANSPSFTPNSPPFQNMSASPNPNPNTAPQKHAPTSHSQTPPKNVTFQTTPAFTPMFLQNTPAKVRVVSKVVVSPELTEDPRLIQEIEACQCADDCYSHYSNKIKRSIGLECEYLLLEQLRVMEITFLTEEDMRKQGYGRTPDFLVQVPFMVNGHIVNWIDSKACFGDVKTWQQNMQQFQAYKIRHGPGLVVFHFGFVLQLQLADPDIFVLSNLPSLSEIHKLEK